MECRLEGLDGEEFFVCVCVTVAVVKLKEARRIQFSIATTWRASRNLVIRFFVCVRVFFLLFSSRGASSRFCWRTIRYWNVAFIKTCFRPEGIWSEKEGKKRRDNKLLLKCFSKRFNENTSKKGIKSKNKKIDVGSSRKESINQSSSRRHCFPSLF